jgi:pyrroline-5-carboxylate reductase
MDEALGNRIQQILTAELPSMSNLCQEGRSISQRRIDLSISDKTIAFIGGGHITEIIIESLARQKIVIPGSLMVSDPDAKRLEYLAHTFSVQTTPHNTEAAEKGDILFINVRPQVVSDVVNDLSQILMPEGKVLVTLAAGIPIKKYKSLGQKTATVRALPNPPSQIGQGIIAVAFNEYVSDIQQKEILKLFDSMGKVVVLEEEHINTVTALSSPASVFLFFKSLIDAGVQMGLDKNTSQKIAAQTIIGVMELWKHRKVPEDKLLKEACTPGGVSEESLAVLDDHNFRSTISEAIRKGACKAEKLGE